MFTRRVLPRPSQSAVCVNSQTGPPRAFRPLRRLRLQREDGNPSLLQAYLRPAKHEVRHPRGAGHGHRRAVAFLVLVPIFREQILSIDVVGQIPDAGWWIMVALYSSDVLIDLTILCLPVFFIRDLRMATSVKFALGGLFTLGTA